MGRQGAKDLDLLGWQADLFPRLAQGSGDFVLVAGVKLATGQGDLAGVVAHGCSALRQDQSAVIVMKCRQNAGWSQLARRRRPLRIKVEIRGRRCRHRQRLLQQFGRPGRRHSAAFSMGLPSGSMVASKPRLLGSNS